MSRSVQTPRKFGVLDIDALWRMSVLSMVAAQIFAIIHRLLCFNILMKFVRLFQFSYLIICFIKCIYWSDWVVD